MLVESVCVCCEYMAVGGDWLRTAWERRRTYRILTLVLDVEKTSTPRFHSILVCHLQDACHKTIPHSLVACVVDKSALEDFHVLVKHIDLHSTLHSQTHTHTNICNMHV